MGCIRICREIRSMEESKSPFDTHQVTTARRVSSWKSKCGGGREPWTKNIKKPITTDTEEKLSLIELVTDLVVGGTIGYDGRRMGEEVNELVTEYARLKRDRPVAERSLFSLTGQEGAQTTEQRLSVDQMKTTPELGRLLRAIEESAPEALLNVVSQVRAMARPVGAGMATHRDGIDLGLDRVVFTLPTGWPVSEAPEVPPEAHVRARCHA